MYAKERGVREGMRGACEWGHLGLVSDRGKHFTSKRIVRA